MDILDALDVSLKFIYNHLWDSLVEESNCNAEQSLVIDFHVSVASRAKTEWPL